MVPAAYPLVIRSSCALESIEAWGTHLATGSQVRTRPASEALLARAPARYLGPDEVPRFSPGDVGPHPAELAEPAPRAVSLGPGTIELGDTRVFAAHQTVEVAAGTRFRMGPGASLIFLGPVAFRGSREQPIVVERADPAQPWGGIALQGPATAGSSFEHVVALGGSTPRWRLVPYPGMVNLHHSRELSLRHCRFGQNQGSDDVLHAAYVRKLSIEDTTVTAAAADAIDLEFVRGTLRNLRLLDIGDDGLDLMASRVQLRDSVLVDCQGNGLSAGEESEVDLRGSLIAGAKAAVLAKNASTVGLAGSLLYRNRRGVRIYQRTVRYAGDSHVSADVLFAVDCKRAVKRDDDSAEALEVGRIQTRLPRDGSLDHLAKDVLGLQGWDELGAWLERHRAGGTR